MSDSQSPIGPCLFQRFEGPDGVRAALLLRRHPDGSAELRVFNTDDDALQGLPPTETVKAEAAPPFTERLPGQREWFRGWPYPGHELPELRDTPAPPFRMDGDDDADPTGAPSAQEGVADIPSEEEPPIQSAGEASIDHGAIDTIIEEDGLTAATLLDEPDDPPQSTE